MGGPNLSVPLAFMVALSFQNIPSFAFMVPKSPVTDLLTISPSAQIKDNERAFDSGGQIASMLLAQKNRNNNRNSEFFPEPGSSYVPSGLTAEEYAKIKKAENQKRSKMNFGAWGPRFARSTRPPGDWMVLPSLWTSGFSINEQEQTVSAVSQFTRGKEFVRQFLPSYLLSIIFVETISTAAYLIQSQTIPAFFSTLAMLVLKVQRNCKAGAFFTMNVFCRVVAIKAFGGLLFSAPAQMLITRLNRRKYWSPRRTIVVSSFISLGMLVLLAFVSARI